MNVRDWQPINAADLHDRVQLERDVITRVNGAEIRTPATVATLWANVDFTSGSEAFKDHTVESRSVAMVTIRWRDDVSAKDRLIHQGKRYEIKSVIPEAQRKTQILLECWSVA